MTREKGEPCRSEVKVELKKRGIVTYFQAVQPGTKSLVPKETAVNDFSHGRKAETATARSQGWEKII